YSSLLPTASTRGTTFISRTPSSRFAWERMFVERVSTGMCQELPKALRSQMDHVSRLGLPQKLADGCQIAQIAIDQLNPRPEVVDVLRAAPPPCGTKYR